jgi:mono/diheme cytochrome c family protein
MRISTLVTLTVLLSIVHFPCKGDSGSGEALFHERCIGCHGPDGRAQTEMGKKAGAADLTSDVVQRQGDSELATIVKDGKGKMPAAGKSLSDEEIHALITYIRQLAKKQ